MNPKALEAYLVDFAHDQRYVTNPRLATYLALMQSMIDAVDQDHPRGIGYYKPLGWFVLEASPEGPRLVWSEKG